MKRQIKLGCIFYFWIIWGWLQSRSWSWRFSKFPALYLLSLLLIFNSCLLFIRRFYKKNVSLSPSNLKHSYTYRVNMLFLIPVSSWISGRGVKRHKNSWMKMGKRCISSYFGNNKIFDSRKASIRISLICSDFSNFF